MTELLEYRDFAIMNENNISDEMLLKQFKAGEDQAFYELFRRYEKPLIGYLYGMTGNLEQSKDVSQETYLKLIKNPPGFLFGGNLKSWLFKSARNRMIDIIRRDSRQQILDDIDEEIDPLPDPHEGVLLNDDFEELYSVIDKLDEKYREVVVLYYFSGMTFKDISKVMGIPIGTALWRMRKAIGMMQELYEKRK